MTTMDVLRALSCAATAATLAVLPACAGDGDGGEEASDPESTAEGVDDETVGQVAQALLDSPDSPLDDDSATCAAEILVADLGGDAALETATSGEGDSLTEDQDASAIRALDDCVPGQAFAAQLLDGFWQGAGATPIDSPELEECVGDSLDGRVGEISMGSDPSGMTDAVVEALDQCLTPADLAAFMAESLVLSGFSPTDADCISEQMSAVIGLRDLLDMAAGVTDPAVQEEIQGSAAACGLEDG